MHLVGAQHVLLGLRGRQHDDRDRRQLRVALDLGEHLGAALARQVEVEQDQVGPHARPRTRLRRARTRIASTPSLTTVSPLPTLWSANASRIEQHVARVVLDQQHRDQVSVHAAHRSPRRPALITGRVNRKRAPPDTRCQARCARRGTRRSCGTAPARCRCPRRPRASAGAGRSGRSARRTPARSPMPLSVQLSSHIAPSRRAEMRTTRRLARRGTSARWRSGSETARRSSGASPRTVGSWPGSITRPPARSSGAASAVSAAATTSSSATGSLLAPAAPDAREREQVVDQHLHPLGAVDGEVDVLLAALVELVGVARLQRLAEARDLAQRLLQVVRGDVGELLELGVRALQLERLLPRAARARPRRLRARRRSARASRRSRAPSSTISRGPAVRRSGLANSPAATRARFARRAASAGA